jgi:hypothetical protein
LIDETATARVVTNRFEVLRVEEGTDETTVVCGKNQGKHKRRAMKRAAQQEAQAKRGRIDYGFVSDFRQRRRQFNIVNDESAHNRFVWYSDSSLFPSIVLTPEMFPPLK